MLISEQWLREWVSPRGDTPALANVLTMAGIEVDSIQNSGVSLNKVVVGEVREIEAHPRASRLKVCKVNVGRARTLTVVCGAPNVVIGKRYPTALIGARLPDGKIIEKVRINEVVSSGMLCSSAELGLDDVAEELMLLDVDAPAGESVESYLGLNDSVLEIDLTPNRGDCLSVAGIAREVSALTGARLTANKINKIRASSSRKCKIRIEAVKDCPRYVGRVIEGIDPTASTPVWMRERLRRSGLRSIGAVVDVTNYVMLELGQPMHAFDLERLQGGIIVRLAKEGEHITLLDGTEIRIHAGTLVIADHKTPVALAGIMGGTGSAITDSSHTILLEAAYFRAGAIAGRARQYNKHTDASHRFERGVDPQLQELATQRATELLLEIVGGKAGTIVNCVSKRHLPTRPGISLRSARIKRLLGITVPSREVDAILRRLGMRLRRSPNGWRVSPPSFRFDITEEHDLIEEVARVHGYAKVPTRAPSVVGAGGSKPEATIGQERIRDCLIDRDYYEVVTYSFVEQGLQAQIEPKLRSVHLANPIASNMAVMRTSLWPGLLQALLTNRSRQHRRVRLFEIGRSFVQEKDEVKESRNLGGLVFGPIRPLHWSASVRLVDFFDAKGDVEALLSLSAATDVQFHPVRHSALHSAQAARITLRGRRIGLIGALHPDLVRQLELDQAPILYQLSLEALQFGQVPQHAEISKFPAVHRDLSVLVDEQVTARQVLDLVAQIAGASLEKLELFDVYRGEGIDSKRKSIAFSLTLRSSSRTLIDEEINKIMGRVVVALETKLGAELRA